ncbi:ArnT family glycosyltransferase [Pyxidicoccus xibeiensis]|uniref:ArnT family glycosyltransferase n=1 Tax=Pyxidicoccus xibeiensis TaxID=2906759 RepID=UPI0020A80C7B|nr:glycosyltransferase family 39 protein [Pyxidicoccus xibeiensis]MCP3137394.1 glycosyltransferase family 39 protein [Pyxidicoccus xibeiensis]
MPETSYEPRPLERWLERWFTPLLLSGLLVNLSGLWVTVAEPDAALYATIARRMAETGNFVELVLAGRDWLDKPHFPFWVTALSFRLFGVGTLSYKLPAVCFWGLSLVYTYLFARHLYSRTVARLAVLLLVSAYHLVLSNNDVRAEPYLTALLVGGLYHLVRAHERPYSPHLVWGALLTACAVMTKGPFVLLAPCGALVLHWLAHRQWRELLRPRWWLALLLVAVFILPELYCLYVQFDLHPEKEVFGRTGVSGLRFFFWDSQFGRFFNTGPIRGKGDPFFFLHTLLWAFLPWSLLLYAACLSRLRSWWRQGLAGQELFTWGAAGVLLGVFSLSGFQLPHYTNILFPFFSIILAAWLDARGDAPSRVLAWTQSGVSVGMVVLMAAALWVFHSPLLLWAGLGLAAATGLVFAGFRGEAVGSTLGRSFGVALAFCATLNLGFLPELVRYQAGSHAAELLNHQPARPTGVHAVSGYAFQLYARTRVEHWDLEALKEVTRAGPVHLYLPEERVPALEEAGLSVRRLGTFEDFRITRPTRAFLDPATRKGTLRPMLLAEVATR